MVAEVPTKAQLDTKKPQFALEAIMLAGALRWAAQQDYPVLITCFAKDGSFQQTPLGAKTPGKCRYSLQLKSFLSKQKRK